MKTTPPFLMVLLLCVAISVAACTGLDRVVTKPIPVAATNTVEIVTPPVRVTNTVGDVEVRATTNYIFTVTTNWVVGPDVRPEIDAATSIISGLPFPWAGTAGVILGWLATAYVALRNRKVAVAMVQGIEAGRVILQTTPEGKVLDEKVRRALMDHQEMAGVLNAASSLVNAYTGVTTKPK